MLGKITNLAGGGGSKAHGLSRRALRRHLHRQLRAAILNHLKRTGEIPVEALLSTEIQTATWWSRVTLGLAGAAICALGVFVGLSGGLALAAVGAGIVAVGAVLVVAAVRGRRRTVREHLGRIWDSVKREAESNLDELVRKSVAEVRGRDADSVLVCLDMNPSALDLGDMAASVTQLGDAAGSSVGDGGDLGDAAGGIADGILDGVFSGL